MKNIFIGHVLIINEIGKFINKILYPGVYFLVVMNINVFSIIFNRIKYIPSV